jgi:IS30 family transposase
MNQLARDYEPMARNSTLTDQDLNQIYALSDQGRTERQIAAALGLSKTKVHGALVKRGNTHKQQEVAALVSGPVADQTRKSVFDTMARLEECLLELEDLRDKERAVDPLKDKVLLRAEKRMLIAEARATLESIYNIRVLNDFVTEVTAILESESPGAKKRIFERFEASAGAYAAISLFSS